MATRYCIWLASQYPCRFCSRASQSSARATAALTFGSRRPAWAGETSPSKNAAPAVARNCRRFMVQSLLPWSPPCGRFREPRPERASSTLSSITGAVAGDKHSLTRRTQLRGSVRSEEISVRHAAAVAIRRALSISVAVAARFPFLQRQKPHVSGPQNLFQLGRQQSVGGDLERRRRLQQINPVRAPYSSGGRTRLGIGIR